MATAQPDDTKSEEKSSSTSKPDPGTLNTTDPQEHMEGPVSSIMQNAEENFEDKGGETGNDGETDQ